jgi:pullulanase/glycogen debranching enzyme
MPEDWTNAESRSLAFLLSGSADGYHLNTHGEPEQDETFFVIFNASPESESYLLPQVDSIECWEPVLETASGGPGQRLTWQAGERYPAAARSVTVFSGKDGKSDSLGPPAR